MDRLKPALSMAWIPVNTRLPANNHETVLVAGVAGGEWTVRNPESPAFNRCNHKPENMTLWAGGS